MNLAQKILLIVIGILHIYVAFISFDVSSQYLEYLSTRSKNVKLSYNLNCSSSTEICSSKNFSQETFSYNLSFRFQNSYSYIELKGLSIQNYQGFVPTDYRFQLSRKNLRVRFNKGPPSIV
ncbi:MAG: hypothetical protein KC646_03480 [Candidatus Cloacimonetes bacterium]|nr:hypothetical protein [Candidatus Cloacimonadota bacterium]